MLQNDINNLMVIKEKIILTDELIKLLEKKKKENKILMHRCKEWSDKFLKYKKDSDMSLLNMKKEHTQLLQCLKEHVQLKDKNESLQKEYSKLETTYNNYINRTETKYQNVAKELDLSMKKCDKLLKQIELLESKLLTEKLMPKSKKDVERRCQSCNKCFDNKEMLRNMTEKYEALEGKCLTSISIRSENANNISKLLDNNLCTSPKRNNKTAGHKKITELEESLKETNTSNDILQVSEIATDECKLDLIKSLSAVVCKENISKIKSVDSSTQTESNCNTNVEIQLMLNEMIECPLLISPLSCSSVAKDDFSGESCLVNMETKCVGPDEIIPIQQDNSTQTVPEETLKYYSHKKYISSKCSTKVKIGKNKNLRYSTMPHYKPTRHVYVHHMHHKCSSLRKHCNSCDCKNTPFSKRSNKLSSNTQENDICSISTENTEKLELAQRNVNNSTDITCTIPDLMANTSEEGYSAEQLNEVSSKSSNSSEMDIHYLEKVPNEALNTIRTAENENAEECSENVIENDAFQTATTHFDIHSNKEIIPLDNQITDEITMIEECNKVLKSIVFDIESTSPDSGIHSEESSNELDYFDKKECTEMNINMKCNKNELSFCKQNDAGPLTNINTFENEEKSLQTQNFKPANTFAAISNTLVNSGENSFAEGFQVVNKPKTFLNLVQDSEHSFVESGDDHKGCFKGFDNHEIRSCISRLESFNLFANEYYESCSRNKNINQFTKKHGKRKSDNSAVEKNFSKKAKIEELPKKQYYLRNKANALGKLNKTFNNKLGQLSNLKCRNIENSTSGADGKLKEAILEEKNIEYSQKIQLEVLQDSKNSNSTQISAKRKELKNIHMGLTEGRLLIGKPAVNLSKANIIKESYKRPNNSIKFIECPRSPDREELSRFDENFPTKVIPVKRINILKISRISFLIKRLILNYDDKIIVNNVLSVLVQQQSDLIIKSIIEFVKKDYGKEYVTKERPLIPLMSKSQKVVFIVLKKLESLKFSDFTSNFLSHSEKAILLETNVSALKPLATLYISICKFTHSLHRMRRMCCDAFYFMDDLAIPFLYLTLRSWLDVLPKASDPKSNFLPKVLVQVTHLKSCNVDQNYHLNDLKDLLTVYHEYPRERYDTDVMMEGLVSELINGNEDKDIDYAIIILCKNQPVEWCYTQIQKHFQLLCYKKFNTSLLSRILLLIKNVVKHIKSEDSKSKENKINMVLWIRRLHTHLETTFV